MIQELEIEYKNILTKNEYQRILNAEFKESDSGIHHHKIIQTNHYFDTKEKLLKNQSAALRIRVLDSKNELTFKVPSDDFLMETNLLLDDSQVTNILNKGYLMLKDLTENKLELNLNNINKESKFIHFNSFKTIRYEKKSDSNLLVLDQTFFQNEFVDYELEVEGDNPIEAKNYFDSILTSYSIPFRKTLPKIARAEKNK